MGPGQLSCALGAAHAMGPGQLSCALGAAHATAHGQLSCALGAAQATGHGQLPRALGAAHATGHGQLPHALGAGGAAEPASPRREAGQTPRQLDTAWRRKASPAPLLVTPALPLHLRSRAVSFPPLTSAGMLGPAHGDPGRTTDSLGLTSSRCPDLCPCDSSRQSPTLCHPRPAAGGLRFRDAHKEKNMFSIRATLNIHK